MRTDRQDSGASIDREDRRLAAIMFTDMTGYTSMTQNNEALALDLLEEYRKILREILRGHGGREVKTIGDAFLIEFRSSLDAVKCAIEMQRALAGRNLEATSIRQIHMRIGLHVGDVVGASGDVYGDTVNVAQRIESLCEPGGIAVSAQIFEQVKNNIQFPIEKMGEYKLKNVEAPTLIYGIRPTAPIKSYNNFHQGQRRFAVLPLVSIGEGDDYIAEGLTEELISAFSRLPALKVVARTTTMRYKESGKSVSQIGNELNASTILEGSVRRYGNKLRINVQLIDTKTEEYVWSENYDRSIEDILDVQHDVAVNVVQALRPKMIETPEVQKGLKTSTKSSEAFLLYLKGRYHLARHTEAEVKLAENLFEQAVEIDPNFAAAHALYAQCHMFLGFFGFVSPQEAFDKAMPRLHRAVALDNDLDIAHMLMGRLLQDKWDWNGAEAEFKHAIGISPNSAEAHYRYALLLNDLARGVEALREVRIAEELDPLSIPVNQIAGTIMYFQRMYHDAVERFQRVLDIEPKAALAQNNLGLAQFEEGGVEEGLAAIKKALEMDPKNMMFRADLCYALCRAGRRSEAMDVLHRAESQVNSEHISPIAISGMYASLGDNDRAIEWLEKAYEEHSPYLASLRVERWFEKIRQDQRFVAILKRLRLID